MKKCPYCGTEYADDAVMCAIDHTPFERPAPPPPPEPKAAETAETAEYHFEQLSEEDRQGDFVTLVRCGNLPAADVIIGRLQTAGIKAFVPDESVMQVMGGDLNAFGYVRVQVAPKDYEAARDLLSDIYDDRTTPRISILTLGVDDLERALRFYRDGLGLRTEGIVGREFEHGAVAFFELQAGLKLAIWPRKSIAQESGLPVSSPSPTDFTMGYNVSSKAQVDAVMEQARLAGAVIIKAAQDTFWGGYAGYFQDPDQHLWEVAWNPQLTVPD